MLKEKCEAAQEILPAAADEQSDLARVQKAMLVHRPDDLDVALSQFNCRGIPRSCESRRALDSISQERIVLRKSATHAPAIAPSQNFVLNYLASHCKLLSGTADDDFMPPVIDHEWGTGHSTERLG